MKKITCILLSMLTSISINLLPSLVQAQNQTQLPQQTPTQLQDQNQATTLTLAMLQKNTKKKISKTDSHDAHDLNNTNEDANESDIKTSTVTEYRCELGNNVSIYNNINDDQYIALRWKKRLHKLTRIPTSTGAHRFENRKYGLLWINIPSKGILLDLKKGQQLANECHTPEQMAQSTN